MKNLYICTGHELKIPDIVIGQGLYVFDRKGKRYMDLESGVWCTALGHRNERVISAITEQADSLMHAGFCYSGGIVQEAAEALAGVTGIPEGKCVFLCSGSEGIEISRQMARHITGKKLSMTLHDSYLGAYSSAADRSRGWFLFDWEECAGCEQKKTCNEDCGKLKAIPEDVSEFIFEPGSSSGFVRFPPRALIRNIAKIVRSNGGMVIANEVTTGVGRTGKWFGYQHYEIRPDIVAVGKGIGNGYPVSAAVIDPAVIERLEKTSFHYSQSHQNDPLGAAVVREVIRCIENDDLIAEAEAKGARFFSQLQSLVDGKRVLAVRGRGLMFAVDLADRTIGDSIYDRLLEKGFIVGNRGGAFRIDPPLITDVEQFDQFISAFRMILEGPI